MEAFILLIMNTCLDLAYSMIIFSQINSNLGFYYIKLVKYFLWYKSRMLDLGLKFEGKVDISNDIVRYVDFYFVRSIIY